MRHKHLLTTLFLLLAVPLAALAQYWESGTQKTNNFYNYTSGGNRYQKTEVWYDINSEQDGKMEFGSTPLGNVKIDGITLYVVNGDDIIWVSGGGESLIVEDVAAGLYRVKITGHPTDSQGQGGNL